MMCDISYIAKKNPAKKLKRKLVFIRLLSCTF